MDSEYLGSLLGGDITHLKPLKSTISSIGDLGRNKRVSKLFCYLVLRHNLFNVGLRLSLAILSTGVQR